MLFDLDEIDSVVCKQGHFIRFARFDHSEDRVDFLAFPLEFDIEFRVEYLYVAEVFCKQDILFLVDMSELSDVVDTLSDRLAQRRFEIV